MSSRRPAGGPHDAPHRRYLSPSQASSTSCRGPGSSPIASIKLQARDNPIGDGSQGALAEASRLPLLSVGRTRKRDLDQGRRTCPQPAQDGNDGPERDHALFSGKPMVLPELLSGAIGSVGNLEESDPLEGGRRHRSSRIADPHLGPSTTKRAAHSGLQKYWVSPPARLVRARERTT